MLIYYNHNLSDNFKTKWMKRTKKNLFVINIVSDFANTKGPLTYDRVLFLWCIVIQFSVNNHSLTNNPVWCTTSNQTHATFLTLAPYDDIFFHCSVYSSAMLFAPYVQAKWHKSNKINGDGVVIRNCPRSGLL